MISYSSSCSTSCSRRRRLVHTGEKIRCACSSNNSDCLLFSWLNAVPMNMLLTAAMTWTMPPPTSTDDQVHRHRPRRGDGDDQEDEMLAVTGLKPATTACCTGIMPVNSDSGRWLPARGILPAAWPGQRTGRHNQALNSYDPSSTFEGPIRSSCSGFRPGEITELPASQGEMSAFVNQKTYPDTI